MSDVESQPSLAPTAEEAVDALVERTGRLMGTVWKNIQIHVDAIEA